MGTDDSSVFLSNLIRCIKEQTKSDMRLPSATASDDQTTSDQLPLLRDHSLSTIAQAGIERLIVKVELVPA